MPYDNRLLELYHSGAPGLFVVKVPERRNTNNLGKLIDWCRNRYTGRNNEYLYPMPPNSYFIYGVSAENEDYIRLITNSQEMAVEFSLIWG